MRAQAKPICRPASSPITFADPSTESGPRKPRMFRPPNPGLQQSRPVSLPRYLDAVRRATHPRAAPRQNPRKTRRQRPILAGLLSCSRWRNRSKRRGRKTFRGRNRPPLQQEDNFTARRRQFPRLLPSPLPFRRADSLSLTPPPSETNPPGLRPVEPRFSPGVEAEGSTRIFSMPEKEAIARSIGSAGWTERIHQSHLPRIEKPHSHQRTANCQWIRTGIDGWPRA